jgi:predicted Zn-dependent protease
MANANPNSPAPQNLLTKIYVLMGAWPKAEQAALLWREHSMGHTLGPDLALADIYLRQPKRDPAGAQRVLAPHVSSATALQNPLATELYAKALVMVDRSRDAADLLKPLIADAPHWRSVWLGLAGSQKDASAASDWIAQVAPSIPADSQKEQVDLANAWYAVSQQFDAPAALDKAEQTVKPLLAGSENLFPVFRLLGQIATARGDYPAAEKADRQALKLDGESFETMNDLAYTLWLEGDGENLAEAQKLAQAATTGRPAEAGFYDTLARIEARRGDRQAAAQTFRTALAKDPASLEAMIGLADLLAHDSATRDQARDLLAQIQRGLEINPRLSSVLRKQYQTARDAIASTL